MSLYPPFVQTPSVVPLEKVPKVAPPSSLEANQASFRGGMNLLPDESKIGPDEYREAFNVFNRFDNLDPVNDSIEIGQEITAVLITGNRQIQGALNAGKYILIFAGGLAWWRLYNGSNWSQVPNFKMSPNATNIYSCAVPASYKNLERKLMLQVDTANNNINYNSQTIFSSALMTSSPSCVVCQDGVTQPYIIFIDPTTNFPNARQTQTYGQWAIEQVGTTNIREYVPIGLQMLYYNGILFVVNAQFKDSSNNIIPAGNLFFRSVEGRPLDFVITIDYLGNKAGDASTASYSPGFGIISSLYVASGYPNGFIVSTGNASIGIVLDTINTVFGEPTFDRDPLFGTGPLNLQSYIDIIGDTAFIDGDGVKSFNAAKQVKIDSNNSIFSLKISKLFEQGIVNQSNPTINNYLIQDPTKTSCASFNGYALFSVSTIYGDLTLCYDTYNSCWVSMLQLFNVGVKYWVSLMPYVKKLYAITYDNRVYDVFSSVTTLPASVTTAGYTYVDASYEQKPSLLRAVFKNTQVNGNVSITPIYDLNSATKPMVKPLTASKKLNNIVYPFINPQVAWQVQYSIGWTGGGSLVNLLHKAEIVGLDQSLGQATQITK